MNIKQKTILSIIAHNGDDQLPLTRADIYGMMEPSECGLFKNLDDLSKVLDNLKVDKKYIDNGLSVIVNGRTKLTWILTEKGREALKNDNGDKNDTLQDIGSGLQDSAKTQVAEQGVIDNTQCDVGEPYQAETGGEIVELTPAQAVEKGIELIRQGAAAMQSQKKIDNRAEKLAILHHIRRFFEPVNDDYVAVIDGMIEDYKK